VWRNGRWRCGGALTVGGRRSRSRSGHCEGALALDGQRLLRRDDGSAFDPGQESLERAAVERSAGPQPLTRVGNGVGGGEDQIDVRGGERSAPVARRREEALEAVARDLYEPDVDGARRALEAVHRAEQLVDRAAARRVALRLLEREELAIDRS